MSKSEFTRLGPLRDTRNVTLTTALFYETNVTGDYTPSFTVKPRDTEFDGVLYPSMKRLYLECLDPTEETFVNLVFDGDWLQWDRIRYSPQLLQYMKRGAGLNPETTWYDEWREELETKLRSMGVRAVIEIAGDKTNKNNFAAAKFLTTGAWKGNRGRPSKAEVIRERRIQSGISAENKEDLDRMEEVEGRLKSVK